MIRRSVQATAWLALAANCAPLFAAPDKRRFRLGACDWSIEKMGDPGAFEVAKQIGLDGVMVSLGTVADDLHLRQPEVQQQYKDAAKKTGLAVSSLAIGELNNIPYKSDPRTVQWVSDSIDVCKVFGVRVVLLAFFSNDDLRDDKAGVDEVVRRLKAVAPKAEKAGVILGIESWLSADQHLEILERVGSKAVQVYYDVCNSNDRGYDIYKEIRKLGKRICEFHCEGERLVARPGQGGLPQGARRAGRHRLPRLAADRRRGAAGQADARKLPGQLQVHARDSGVSLSNGAASCSGEGVRPQRTAAGFGHRNVRGDWDSTPYLGGSMISAISGCGGKVCQRQSSAVRTRRRPARGRRRERAPARPRPGWLHRAWRWHPPRRRN